MRRCSDKLAKLLMVIFNLLFLICGIGILALGLANVSFDGHVKTIVQNLSVVNVVFLVVGGIIFFVSFMGFYGACRENSCFITTFMLCMIFILVLQIAVAGLALANRDELKKIVEEGLRETVHRRGNDTLINNAWNDLEISLKCCGADGPDDYKDLAGLPGSCCTNKVEVCKKTDSSFHNKPCIPELEGALKVQYLKMGVVAIIVIFVEVIGIIFSCCLRSAIKERYETV